jgi:hypothetical protein
MARHHTALPTLLGLTLSLAVVLAPVPSEAAEVCDEQVCVDGASWTSDAQLDDKARAREAKRNRKGKDSTLTVELTQGRGSVFVDGVWIAPAPINFVPIKPGKHDLEIRDGERVLARGVLEVGKKPSDVTVRMQ